MQSPASAAVLALLFWVSPVCTERRGEASATRWLREHPAAQADELAELKSENPQAYALVKALLAKRSLGLLNPRHPTASFAAPAQSAESSEVDASASGPAAFQAVASPGDSPASTVVAAPHPHRDWLNWHPSQSAADDDAMVTSVLGAVAQLKGARPSAMEQSSSGLSGHGAALPVHANSAKRSLATSELSWAANVQSSSADGTEDVAAVVTPAAPASMKASRENSYLKGLDLGVAPAVPRPTGQENSYLKSVDLGSPKAKPLMRRDSTDYLAAFSWDDEPRHGATAAVSGAAPAASSSEEAQAGGSTPAGPQPKQGPHHSNALLTWLGGDHAEAGASAAPAPAPLQEAAAAPAGPQNAYLAYLQ